MHHASCFATVKEAEDSVPPCIRLCTSTRVRVEMK